MWSSLQTVWSFWKLQSQQTSFFNQHNFIILTLTTKPPCTATSGQLPQKGVKKIIKMQFISFWRLNIKRQSLVCSFFCFVSRRRSHHGRKVLFRSFIYLFSLNFIMTSRDDKEERRLEGSMKYLILNRITGIIIHF